MNTSSYLKEVACAKINLNFKVLKKLPSSFHKIDSFVAFLPQLYDTLLIKKNSKNKIFIKGAESKELLRLGGDTLITKSIDKIAVYYKIKINLEVILNKSIPLGAGLGGGSANAAAIIRAILKIYNLKKKKDFIALLNEIGSDVPVCFFSQNSQVTGVGDIIKPLTPLNQKLWVLLIKPNILSETKNIFYHFEGPYSKRSNFIFNLKNIINDINTYQNSLEITACRLERKIKELIDSLPSSNNITKPRITGSGSTVFLLFEKKKDLTQYKNEVKHVLKNYWSLSTYIYL
jgi:4-diphosphocytidyl-2-C-methyl-D-erythritol kinase